MGNKFNFTERALENLLIPKDLKPATYYDTGTRDGLCVIVTYGGAKTYYSYVKFNGAPKRTKIGRVGQIKLFKAREIAHSLKEKATLGEDPSAKRREDLKDITIKQFYENVYKPEHSEIHKRPGSINNDNSIFTHRLAGLHNRKLLSIKPEEIERLHNKVKKELSPYTANRVLSLIKHMYVIAIKRGYIPSKENPASPIHKFPEQSRDRFLQSDEIKQFFEALKSEPNEIFKNYILISLFSGLRRSNVLSLRWSYIDLQNGFIRVPDSKNGEPIQIPMTSHLKELLETIKANSESDWVIPSNKSASGHLEDPKRPWQDLLVRACIKDFRLHDLRRTQGSYQAITGASLHIVGKSLGHKSTSATQVYARLTADPIRESMQKATDKILEFVGN